VTIKAGDLVVTSMQAVAEGNGLERAFSPEGGSREEGDDAEGHQGGFEEELP